MSSSSHNKQSRSSTETALNLPVFKCSSQPFVKIIFHIRFYSISVIYEAVGLKSLLILDPISTDFSFFNTWGTSCLEVVQIDQGFQLFCPGMTMRDVPIIYIYFRESIIRHLHKSIPELKRLIFMSDDWLMHVDNLTYWMIQALWRGH